MSTLAIIGIGLLLVIAVGCTIYEFFVGAHRFIAPDNADRDSINTRYGQGTPKARAALERRFGADSHWRDAVTGLAGLAGLTFVLWLWVG